MPIAIEQADHADLCARFRAVRAALADLVGSTDPIELRQMEAVTRMMPAPDTDKAAIINAIHVLLKEYP